MTKKPTSAEAKAFATKIDAIIAANPHLELREPAKVQAVESAIWAEYMLIERALIGFLGRCYEQRGRGLALLAEVSKRTVRLKSVADKVRGLAGELAS